MNLITLGEAKNYLRVDSGIDDNLILSLLASAEKITTDVARMSAAEWDTLCDETVEEMTIRDADLQIGEILQLRDLLRSAVLYSLGYLYEHREEANHHDLMMTLRNLLSSVREGVF